MINVFVMAVLVITSTLGFSAVGFAAEEHTGHSDDLLLILKDKITLQKHIKHYPTLSTTQQEQSRAEQQRLLHQALLRLKHYVAIPENRYPNMAMYHESLKSRAALIEDFAQLLIRSHCLHDTTCHAP